MKIKLTQPGWEGYTGIMGGISFVDGSADNVEPQVARRLANVMSVETEDGKNPSASQEALESRTFVPPSNTLDQKGYQKPNAPAAPAGETVVIKERYTRAELEDIASKDGIAGLRKIGDPINVKNKSIVKLIEELLDFWKAKDAQAAGDDQDATRVPAAAPAVAEVTEDADREQSLAALAAIMTQPAPQE